MAAVAFTLPAAAQMHGAHDQDDDAIRRSIS